MLHDKRAWCVSEVASAEELAEQITSTTWCCCTAFRISNRSEYVWLNDSTSPDGAQEYAVCKIEESGKIRQIESITFGWCNSEEALNYIVRTLNGEDDNGVFSQPVAPTLQTPEEHGRCGHCA